MYPLVVSTEGSTADQKAERCPFLTMSKEVDTLCIKSANSRGVCTVNSPIGGERKDWLVCPYRAMTPHLLERATRRLFQVPEGEPCVVKPAVSLAKEDVREEIAECLRNGHAVFTYFDEKLGGELSIPGTPKSPEFSFDVTIVEIVTTDEGPAVGRFGILEIQTMDFHGSYRVAVRNLTENLRMFPETFAEVLRANPRLLGEDVEGPNIANVFKRTFYQMMFKFQLGLHDKCVGCVLAIPMSVWKSWQPHLGGADLEHVAGSDYLLRKPGELVEHSAPAWIFIFDTELSDTTTPSPLPITHEVATEVASLGHYALEVAPAEALAAIDSERGFLRNLGRRITAWWPELGKTLKVTSAARSGKS